MKIEVRLFATLRQDRFNKRAIDFPDGCTVTEVLDRLEIDPQDLAILLVNGRDAAADQPLKADDVLALFPPVAGG